MRPTQEVTAMGVHSVALSDAEEDVVGGLVASGRYSDAGEAVRAGLAAGLKVLDEEAARAAFVARINAAYDEAKAGARAPGTYEEIMERVRRRARGE
jgi:antitoxin ParD1/3/4